MGKADGKLTQTLFKSERRNIYHIYLSLSGPMSLERSMLVICKILRLFVNTFTAYDKYFALNREYLRHFIHMQLSQKEKTLSNFFFEFLKSNLNFEHIQKKG